MAPVAVTARASLRVAALGCVAALWGGTSASAQAAAAGAHAATGQQADAVLREQAREAFAQGVQWTRQGRWREAEIAFETAYDRAPTPNSAFNLAVARYHLGAYVAAARALDDYAAVLDVSAPPPAEAQRLRQMLDGIIAHLTLRVSPADVELHIDGTLRRGLGERRMLALDPGDHALQLTSVGHAPSARSIHLDAGESAQLEVALEPLPETAASQAHRAPPPSSRAAEVRDDPAILRWTTFSIAALGAAGLLAAGGLGIAALERNAESKDACDGNDCLPAGHAARTQARDFGDAATVVGVTGGALLVGALVVWLALRPDRRSAQPKVAFSAAGDRVHVHLNGAL